ncbi:hypothetical protein [Dyadobacter tibetensis]|uniref:hypothetical protein n=1 Tax=Dyadobacter tibetensis TaxID=1211851 RepID=UPI0004729361|nr:hypothetical protein [Dyadobacter tibetensis]
MKLFKIAIVCFVSITIISSCRKISVDPELPAATQEGKNTFGCKVDGRIWEPKGSFSTPAFDLSYDPTWNGGTMSIKAYRSFKENPDINIVTKEFISISLGEVSKPGQYSFNTQDSLALGNYTMAVQDQTGITEITKVCYYDAAEDSRSGMLNITKLDMGRGIISGTFEFTLTKKNPITECNPVLKITEGRFDLKM